MPYVASLLYLSVFGSIVAFGAYLRLMALIGPERAGYNAMLTPVVALLLSTAFEGYRWTLPAAAGLVLIVLGNALVLRRPAGSS
jgi:drug/metabolite transporter (DMT)-like permease